MVLQIDFSENVLQCSNVSSAYCLLRFVTDLLDYLIVVFYEFILENLRF